MKKTVIISLFLLFSINIYSQTLLPLTCDTENKEYIYQGSETYNYNSCGGKYSYSIKMFSIGSDSIFNLVFSISSDESPNMLDNTGCLPYCVLTIYNKDKISIGAFILNSGDPSVKIAKFEKITISDKEFLIGYSDKMQTAYYFWYSLYNGTCDGDGSWNVNAKYFSVHFIASGAG